VLEPFPRPLPEAKRGDQERSHSALVTPIKLHGEVIGALGIHDEDGARQWNEDEIAVVEAITERLALAAENLRLFDETQRYAARERLIAEVTTHMRAMLDLESVLKTAADEMYQALELDEIVIRLATEEPDRKSV